jgi:hypothetical protein
LDENSRSAVLSEMASCGSSSGRVRIALRSSGGAYVGGKMWFSFDKEAPLTNRPVSLVKEISPEEFQKRLIKPGQAEAGIRMLRALLADNNFKGERWQVESVGPFLLVGSGASRDDVRRVGELMQDYLHFYTKRYAMVAPSHLITIYMLSTPEEMQDVARAVHGLQLSPASIGYSFQDDLSLMAVMPFKAHGTLGHELFHLMVRSNFGDIPPWLDEGMAALYEVAEVRGAEIVGQPNWRSRVLKEYLDQRPALDKLVKMDWRSFDNSAELLRRDALPKSTDVAFVQQAVNHATARYFSLYLQEKGKLSEVYNALRNRDPDDILDDPGSDAVRRLSTVLRQPLPAIERDFTNWLKSTVGIVETTTPIERPATNPAVNNPTPSNSPVQAPPSSSSGQTGS